MLLLAHCTVIGNPKASLAVRLTTCRRNQGWEVRNAAALWSHPQQQPENYCLGEQNINKHWWAVYGNFPPKFPGISKWKQLNTGRTFRNFNSILTGKYNSLFKKDETTQKQGKYGDLDICNSELQWVIPLHRSKWPWSRSLQTITATVGLRKGDAFTEELKCQKVTATREDSINVPWEVKTQLTMIR